MGRYLLDDKQKEMNKKWSINEKRGETRAEMIARLRDERLAQQKERATDE
ncbi:hypothetical protein [Weissella soli]|uniref:Uncharacterized protein n=1 Tax=Weissella soli TaxID=155866 RepID=A0A288Q9G6_9LACO|nr:hypothetical protein [Weissella soli]AOT56530.1 hypothetical protein WSWS_00898 [Weissella soli]NKY82983.1 hypothetical protein [Weissella soli]RDL12098.1 hypothetical protein DFP99_0527 [Weissella soli]GEN92671.1 hypothetical protein WSO01_02830 [Weissella soli]GJM48446.1 hypothetical protein WSSLDB02_10030 [Weissella soli]